MAIKKSQLYSKLWQACDELRGGMDASQYKDYVLVVLFVKYLSDKAKSGGSDLLVALPAGCSFDDLVSIKNTPDVGERVNVALDRIAKANPTLDGVVNNADFADENKLGKGKDLVETVSKLIGVFQDPELDFSRNRAADDDLIGDAYEYLMRNFATQSGKSKGQFYTPAEVSRVMARLVGIAADDRPGVLSIYDPTCGSGSLLLRARAEARREVSLDGQERDLATIGMARMSMIIHGVDDAELRHGNTLTGPLHRIDGTTLRTFDYVVANPPFSTKNWLKGGNPEDPFRRWGSADGVPPVPPPGCGDYAFLLHVLASMKPGTGRAAVILPHGVLFRGGAELEIRRWLLRRNLVAGVVGLPPNLFFGTGIPACILVLDKSRPSDPASRDVFLVDAKDGFAKDGAKNRLRECDVRRIVDVWEAGRSAPHYARSVPFAEIERNDFNLNLPRYVAPAPTEIRQDLDAHLRGGIPADEAAKYPSCLFAPLRAGFVKLAVPEDRIAATLAEDPATKRRTDGFLSACQSWCEDFGARAQALNTGDDPKKLIAGWGDTLLQTALRFAAGGDPRQSGGDPRQSGGDPRQPACDVLRFAACGDPRQPAGGVLRFAACGEAPFLPDPYEVYEVLMAYWAETLQDDCYLVSRDGWKAALALPKKKSFAWEDLACDLLPPKVVAGVRYGREAGEIEETKTAIEAAQARIDELLAELEEDDDPPGEVAALKKETASLRRKLKAQNDALSKRLVEDYAKLRENEIKNFVVDRKWAEDLWGRFRALADRRLASVASDVKALADRYAEPLPALEAEVETLRAKVMSHLAQMGVGLEGGKHR